MEFPKGPLNLFLTEIGEPSDNELRIVVAEGLLGEPMKIELEGIDLGEGREIEVSSMSHSFEINWDNYVAYVVRNESFWMAEKGEPPFSGDHLYQRFNSAFQRYVFSTTFGNDEYPGPLEHWCLNTLNHIVDVMSVGPPSVTPLSPAG